MLTHKLHHFHLKNGIEVVVYPMKSVGAMSFQLGLNAGSALEGKEAGVLHFLEHMLLMGSKKYPTIKDITIKSEEMAVTNNARVGMVDSRFWFYGPAVKEEEIVTFASDLLMYPLFTEEAVDNTKKVILDEYARYWNAPENRYGNAVDKVFYGEENPYTIDALGTKEKIESITRNDLLSLYKAYYQGQNIKISIAGNVHVTKMKSILENTFGKMKRGDVIVSHPTAAHPTTYTTDLFIFDEPRDYVKFNFSFPIEGSKTISTEKRLQASLASYLFGDSITSILYNRLRHDLGLVYHISSSNGRWPYVGRFGINGGVSGENLIQCISEIKASLGETINRGFNKKDFERARAFMNMRTYLSYSEPGNIAGRFLDDLLSEENPFFPEDYEKITNKFTVSQINNALRNMVNFERVFLALFGDKKTILKTGIEKEFKKFKEL